MSDRLKMGLIGCGGMSGAHMRGYQELWSKDIKAFDIVAACDIDATRAEERATQAHEFQGGTQPAVYTDVEEMLSKHSDLDCVDICALHSAHHTLAVTALEAGKHVIIEKPLGITVRACKLIVDAAKKMSVFCLLQKIIVWRGTNAHGDGRYVKGGLATHGCFSG